MEYKKEGPSAPPGWVDPPPPGPIQQQPPPAYSVGNAGGGAATPQVVFYAAPGFTNQPQRMTCPHCQADVLTETIAKHGLITHLVAVGLCLVGCWCCCCIPYCVDDLQDVDHVCANCKRTIGTYKRFK